MTQKQADDSGLSFIQDNFAVSGHKNLVKRSSRGRTPTGDPNPVDVYIGSRIKLRRQALALSQEKLADLMGTTFQQVQKYERGANRVSGSRMWDLCCILEVDPSYFYAEMPKKIREGSPRFQYLNPIRLHEGENDILTAVEDPMMKAESIILVTAYEKIPNRKLAKSLYNAMINASYSYEPKEGGPEDDDLDDAVIESLQAVKLKQVKPVRKKAGPRKTEEERKAEPPRKAEKARKAELPREDKQPRKEA